MSVKRGGLGRNLSALLQVSDIQPTAMPDAVSLTIPIDTISPGQYQPRLVIDEHALKELALSIQKQGLLQPIVVRPKQQTGRYEILAGERRWRACQLAGLSSIPVFVRVVNDETAMAIALVENLQRESLNAMEQARAMQRLSEEFGLTHQDIAGLLSKSRAAVSNFLRLLNLNKQVQGLLESGALDMGHARCLLMLEERLQLEVAELVVARGFSVRETEAWVARLNTKMDETVSTREQTLPSFFRQELTGLAQQLNTRVSLRTKKSGEGTLMIHYDNHHNLKLLIEKICQISEV